ncbi:hypothetical protein SLS62_010725 [Diatrype stigma]|uniref:Heme haloperoxidase family profile domain-containing protein n=1 Tax=Diatrype stigma TaxID=117547 RepID=A0AAN9YFQ1_9PEZI
MMNTLANHNFIQHDGANITKENAIKGLKAALNFDADLASIMFDQAVIANPEPNATYFTLDHLNVHGVLEHDASLSRLDAHFGNNHVFNQGVFDETKSYWTEPILTAQMLANSKLARQITSRAFNPNYTFTSSIENFSLGELAAPIIAFGDLQTGLVNRTLVEYLFENERLPFELGWSRRDELIDLNSITSVVQIIGEATNLLTDAKNTTAAAQRRGLHF